jgi:hypothetical protein
MKDSKKVFKNLGFIGVGLCAACCLLPIIGVLLGMGALTFLTGILEMAGIIALVGAIVFFAVYYFKERKAPACDTNCGCKSENETAPSKN